MSIDKMPEKFNENKSESNRSTMDSTWDKTNNDINSFSIDDNIIMYMEI
jgi:hypothetical protein